jgi:Protein of unknown function (DUF2793)
MEFHIPCPLKSRKFLRATGKGQPERSLFMVNTAQLGLPLVMAAQAQKHVTVNEALAKLDAFSQLRLASLSFSEPPELPKPGQSYFISGEGSGTWVGQSGKIATYVNGGWSFTEPLVGWRAWDEENRTWTVFDGIEWVSGALTVSPSAAGAVFKSDEFDHAVERGTVNATSYHLPENSVVFGITGRVLVGIAGVGLQSWRLGVNGSDGRYGTGLGLERTSYILGLTGSPMSYFQPTPLLVSAEEGEFESGRIRLCVHYLSLLVPRSV